MEALLLYIINRQIIPLMLLPNYGWSGDWTYNLLFCVWLLADLISLPYSIVRQRGATAQLDLNPMNQL